MKTKILMSMRNITRTTASRVLFFICLALSLSSIAASADEISYAEMLEKKKGKVDTYIASNGEIFRVGESLTLGLVLETKPMTS